MRPLPQRPSQVSEYAKACLDALAAAGLAKAISLGGAFGLLHYLDYRTTHDVDAWWALDSTADQRHEVLRTLDLALKPFGSVRTRAWGDVASVELQTGGRTVFSFQIAVRSAQLAQAAAAPWSPVLLDSFEDLIASKMVALVERGAPRDFRDIHAVCQAGLTNAAECWALWRRRQELSGDDADSSRARLAVGTHLARIAQHRPLDSIADPGARAAAHQVREWFSCEFLNALQP